MHPTKMTLVVLQSTHPPQGFLWLRKRGAKSGRWVGYFRISKWRPANFWCIMATLWGAETRFLLQVCPNVWRLVAVSVCQEEQHSTLLCWLHPLLVVYKQNSRRMVSPGMLHRVALVRTDVSEKLSASFIRVTRTGELGTTLAVTSNQRTLRSSAGGAKFLQNAGSYKSHMA
jgi:hypothetical protein